MAAHYVTIYCDTQRRRDYIRLDSSRRWQEKERGLLGKCFAQKVNGQWQCCCCGKNVKVAA